MKKILITILLLITCIVLYAGPTEIIPGITHEKLSSYNGEKQIINIARIDLTKENIHIKVGLGDSRKTVKGKPYGKEPVSSIVEKHNALLGVNADYFILESFRDTLNFSMVDREIISEPQYNREVMFICKDNHIFFDIPKLETKLLTNSRQISVTGINRARSKGDVILYTDRFASSTLGKYKSYDIVFRPVFNEKLLPNSQITLRAEKIIPDTVNTEIEKNCFVLSTTLSACPDIAGIKEGDILTLDVRLYTCEDTKNILYATGGGPRLVENGEIHITSKEGHFKNDITGAKAPRTAVGISENGTEMIIATVDGRFSESKGMTLSELAEFMKNLGAYNAINFDGGGSTDMSIMGLVLGHPSDGSERSVANALLVTSDTEISTQDYIKDSDITYRTDRFYSLDDSTSGRIWGVKGSIGYIDNNSIFHTSSKKSKGKIGYIENGVRYYRDIEISDAVLKEILLEQTDIQEYEDCFIYKCKAKMTDSDGKAMSDSPIYIYSKNGKLNQKRYISDKDGIINFETVFYKNCEETEENTEYSVQFVIGDFNRVYELQPHL